MLKKVIQPTIKHLYVGPSPNSTEDTIKICYKLQNAKHMKNKEKSLENITKAHITPKDKNTKVVIQSMQRRWLYAIIHWVYDEQSTNMTQQHRLKPGKIHEQFST